MAIQFEKVAWMGGSKPNKLSSIDSRERQMVSIFFQEQMYHFIRYWESYPDKDTTRLFWNRARHDAHSSRREELSNEVS